MSFEIYHDDHIEYSSAVKRDVIEAAMCRISDPSKWGVHYLAVDQTGKVVEPWSPGACRWCAIGAIDREIYDRYHGSYYSLALRDEISQDFYVLHQTHISYVNDHGSREQVIDLLQEQVEHLYS